MDLKANIGFHNRFDIEVRDKDTGEVKQRGQAENIVLDRAYTRLCNYSTYFVNIFFGSGTGTLDPTRTTLFSSLGYKAAATEETIKAFPISKWTRKITLNPEEYVGATITEVGISDTTNAINTHALITDAEGNPLSINKTDIDVVVIYATVFIEFQNKSDSFRFVNFPSSNALLNYMVGGSAPASTLLVGTMGDDVYLSSFMNMSILSKTLTKTIDVANKKVAYSSRLAITEANSSRIAEFAFLNSVRCSLPEPSVFLSYDFEDVALGTGDGVTTTFPIKHTGIINEDIKANSVSLDSEDYSLNDTEPCFAKYTPLFALLADGETPDPRLYEAPYNGVQHSTYPPHTLTIKVAPTKIINRKIHYKIQAMGMTSNDKSVYIYGSYDGSSYTTLVSRTVDVGDIAQGSVLIEVPYNYLRIRTTSQYTSANYVNTYYFYAENTNTPSITFDSPPADGAGITANYTVPYIPKDENYVLDITMEVIFGEGV